MSVFCPIRFHDIVDCSAMCNGFFFFDPAECMQKFPKNGNSSPQEGAPSTARPCVSACYPPSTPVFATTSADRRSPWHSLCLNVFKIWIYGYAPIQWPIVATHHTPHQKRHGVNPHDLHYIPQSSKTLFDALFVYIYMFVSCVFTDICVNACPIGTQLHSQSHLEAKQIV